MLPSCSPWHGFRPRLVTTRCCMQVEERLHVLGDFPRHVFADSSDEQPLAEVERAVANLTMADLALGFTHRAVGSRDSATSMLTMIRVRYWPGGEHSSPWSTALQS